MTSQPASENNFPVAGPIPRDAPSIPASSGHAAGGPLDRRERELGCQGPFPAIELRPLCHLVDLDSHAAPVRFPRMCTCCRIRAKAMQGTSGEPLRPKWQVPNIWPVCFSTAATPQQCLSSSSPGEPPNARATSSSRDPGDSRRADCVALHGWSVAHLGLAEIDQLSLAEIRTNGQFVRDFSSLVSRAQIRISSAVDGLRSCCSSATAERTRKPQVEHGRRQENALTAKG
ncbi:hypothetical protein ABIC10_001051 [Bradyrhizobium sp. S3.2.12]